MIKKTDFHNVYDLNKVFNLKPVFLDTQKGWEVCYIPKQAPEL